MPRDSAYSVNSARMSVSRDGESASTIWCIEDSALASLDHPHDAHLPESEPIIEVLLEVGRRRLTRLNGYFREGDGGRIDVPVPRGIKPAVAAARSSNRPARVSRPKQ